MNRLRDWSPYLAALGIALIVGAVVLLSFNIIEMPILLGLVGLGIFLIALFVIYRPTEVRKAVTGRTAVYGSNSLIMSLAFVGIIAVALWLVDRTPQLHQRIDMTAGKSRTLSELTINVLKNLKEPITITGFFIPGNQGSPATDFRTRITDYKLYSDKITYREIDSQASPGLVQEYDVAQLDGTVVVERGSGPTSRKEKVYASDENTLTNALLKVTQTQQTVLYFTTGHGERNLTDSQDQGMNTVRDLLTQLNYVVQPLNLAIVTNTVTISGTSPVSGSLPIDTSAVIIAGPTKPFPADDAGRIKDYLDHGGRVLLMADWGTDTGLTSTLTAWGIDLGNDLVLDPGQSAQGRINVPVIAQFPTHDVTKNLDQYGVFFPNARSVSSSKTPPAGRTPVDLFPTTARACGKTDIEALKASAQSNTPIPSCDPAKDEKGPLNLGSLVEANVSATDSSAKGRLIVIGTSNVVANYVLNQGLAGNQLLVQNMINWLVGEEQLIAIPPRQQTNPQLGLLTGNDNALILGSTVILLPLAVLLLGGIIWWRRR